MQLDSFGHFLAGRNEHGFYTPFEPSLLNASDAVTTVLANGNSLAYRVSKNSLEADAGAMYEIHASVFLPGESRPVLLAECILTDCAGVPAWKDLIFAAEDHSQRLSYAAERIAYSCILAPEGLGVVGSVLEVSRLDLREDAAGAGLGVRLGKELLDHLAKEYQVAAFLLVPFPLQFEGFRKRAALDVLPAAERAFRKSTDKLKRCYAMAWGAEAVGGRELMVMPAAGHSVEVIGEGWLVE